LLALGAGPSGRLDDDTDLDARSQLQGRAGLGHGQPRLAVVGGDQRVAADPGAGAAVADFRGLGDRVPVPGMEPPEPTRLGEVSWLEPYPDVLLDGLPDDRPGPEARSESFEAISLAFITALQLLPPRQRAVLILRDVLGFRAREVADVLESTEESVTSLLKRARAALHRRPAPEQPPATPGSAAEQDMLARLSRAYEATGRPSGER
jgi:hypothetical protein